MAQKTWNEMTSKQKASYNSVYLDNWDTINDAIILHRIRLRSTDITSEEEAEVDTQLPVLFLKLALLDAKNQARTSPSIRIKPPTASQVKKAQDLAEESDQLIAQQQQLARSFQIATAALQLAGQIQALPNA